MVDIVHRVGIATAPKDVYQALTTTDGLSRWWTSDTSGEAGNVGGVVKFRFERGGFDMAVRILEPDTGLVWEVIDGPEEWVGTTISWELRQDNDWTIVMFKHQNWAEPVEFMHHCSTKWAIFLMSLKSLLETGKGQPEPYDVKIDNWN